MTATRDWRADRVACYSQVPPGINPARDLKDANIMSILGDIGRVTVAGAIVCQLTACGDGKPSQPSTSASGGQVSSGVGGSAIGEGSGGDGTGTSSGGSGAVGMGGSTSGATGGDTGSTGVGGTTGDPSIVPLLPWAEGNTWTYLVTESDGTTSTKTNTVGPEEPVGGTGPNADTLAFKATTLKDDGADKTESWQAVVGNRLVRYREIAYSASTGAPNGEVYWEPNKMRVDWSAEHTVAGATWSETYNEYEDQMDGNGFFGLTVVDDWRVDSVGQTVTVPAGTFDNAIVLARTSDGSEKFYWFVAGVGKVKEEGGQTEELVSYQVNP